MTIKFRWEWTVIVVLVVLLISEFIWYAPSGPARESYLEVHETTIDGDWIEIMFEIHSNLATEVTVVALPIISELKDLPVYVFYDENYTTRGLGSSWFRTLRLWEHLRVGLALRGYTEEIRLVGARGLEEIFLSDPSAIVVMDYGAFPSNIFSWETNMVRPWIEKGGTLVWLGWPPGYYTVDREQEEVTSGMPNQLQWEGVSQIGLEGFYEKTGYTPQSASIRTEVSRALDIEFDDVSAGPLLSRVLGARGSALGKIGGHLGTEKSSVSVVPLGEGRIVLFGFFTQDGPRWETTDWRSVVRDIAQILFSGVLEIDPDFGIEYRSYELSYGEIRADSVRLHIEEEMKGIVVYGYSSKDSNGLLFGRWLILTS